jgi:hypothetical protein
MKTHRLITVLAALLCAASLAQAVTIYTFTGAPFDSWLGAWDEWPEPLPTHITFTVTMASALPASQEFGSWDPIPPGHLDPNVLSWSMSDGVHTIDSATLLLDGSLGLWLETDPNGDIQRWNIGASVYIYGTPWNDFTSLYSRCWNVDPKGTCGDQTQAQHPYDPDYPPEPNAWVFAGNSSLDGVWSTYDTGVPEPGTLGTLMAGAILLAGKRTWQNLRARRAS